MGSIYAHCAGSAYEAVGWCVQWHPGDGAAGRRQVPYARGLAQWQPTQMTATLHPSSAHVHGSVVHPCCTVALPSTEPLASSFLGGAGGRDPQESMRHPRNVPRKWLMKVDRHLAALRHPQKGPRTASTRTVPEASVMRS
jgi:hypothetical protein